MTWRPFVQMDNRGGAAAVPRTSVLLGLTIVVCVALFPSPASGQYPTGGQVDGALTVSDDRVVAGSQLTISGSGFRANSEALIVFQSSPLGTAPTSSSGSLSAEVTLPADARPGAHTITATGPAPDGGTRVLSSRVIIRPAQSQQPGQSAGQPSRGMGATGVDVSATRGGGLLPRTGGGIAMLVGGALAAWMTGALLVAAGRRRRDALGRSD